MSIESALKSVDARCVRYIIGFSPFDSIFRSALLGYYAEGMHANFFI